MTIDRRKFIKTTGVAVTGVCLCGVGVSGCGMVLGKSNTPAAPEGSIIRNGNKIIVNLDMIPKLKTDGGAVKFEYADNNDKKHKVIIVHTSGDDYRAFSNRCTHKGRELEFKPEDSRLQCVSFGHSKFDLEGKVISGPAGRPLDNYSVKREESSLIISV